jgi:SAM-dependent methyltransferase
MTVHGSVSQTPTGGPPSGALAAREAVSNGAHPNGERASTPVTVQLLRTPAPHETRSPEQLREHYLLEKDLAMTLRLATKAERGKLYSSAYEELFRRIPHHPQLTGKVSAAQRAQRIAPNIALLRPWLTPQTTFLEIGAGDCALSFALAEKVAHVYAIDVSAAITQTATRPQNFTLVLSDGTSIPVPEGRITVAYSNQLMEHLHPDDALDQLANIYRALAPGGVYICLTPNRLTGPHDISRYFDTVATGFHLKEYTCAELIALFRHVGFRSVQQCLRKGSTHVRVPGPMARYAERTIERLPPRLQKRASTTRLVRGLLEICLIATK